MRRPSAKESAPAGTSMNSCRSSEFCACAPPLTTFIIGTGSTFAPSPPIQRKSATPAFAAAAFAIEVAVLLLDLELDERLPLGGRVPLGALDPVDEPARHRP